MDQSPPKDVLGLDVRKFIRRNIHSVAMLEVLIHLFKHTQRMWSVEELTSELRSSRPAIELRLDLLIKKGLVIGNAATGYRYEPSSSELGQHVAHLQKTYAQYSTRVIELIYSRQSSAQELADAFHFNPGTMKMAEAVYVLCALTSVACAYLLLRRYIIGRTPLLFWTAVCFLALAANNVLLYVDLVVTGPSLDLSIVRTATMLVGLGCLLYGLVWEKA